MRRISIMGLALAALCMAPATALGKAEQFVDRIVDETFTLEIDDPCTGVALHGEATENGQIRTTDLGSRGLHERVNTNGLVELFDHQGAYVGTWTYQVRFINALPPGGQGAVTLWLGGPMTYADGARASWHWLEQQVFGKGDVPKRDFIKSSCGGA